MLSLWHIKRTMTLNNKFIEKKRKREREREEKGEKERI